MASDSKIPSIVSLKQERKKREQEFQNSLEKKVQMYKYSKVYEIVKKRCIEKIHYTNTRTNLKYIICDIPLISTDSLYSIDHCVEYIKTEFDIYGYNILFKSPNYIVIDWSNPKTPKAKVFSKNNEKLYEQTMEILTKHPEVNKVEYIKVSDSFKKSTKRRSKK